MDTCTSFRGEPPRPLYISPSEHEDTITALRKPWRPCFLATQYGLREVCSLEVAVVFATSLQFLLPCLFPAQSCCLMNIFIYSHQPLPVSTYVEFAVAATDCVAKDVTDPANCNLLAEQVSRPGPGNSGAGCRTQHA